MENDINTHLEQISRLIQGLKENNYNVEEMAELDEALEVLSHKIKTAKLELIPDSSSSSSFSSENKNTRQDAILFIDSSFKLVRYSGSFKSFAGNRGEDSTFQLNEFFEPESFTQLQEKTSELLQTGKPQVFNAKMNSKNQILLPVKVLLEKVRFGNDQELIAAGLNFTGDDPNDLIDYQEILIENLPDMDVFLFDTDYRHVLAGGREKERFNLTNSFFTGKTLFEVYDEKMQKRLYPFYRNALDGKFSEGEVRMKKEIYFVSSTPVRDIKNEVAGGALIFQNVTKEKEIEKNLIRAKKEAEEADKAKSLFLANMSHEIRTPLNSIIGFTDLLRKTDLTKKQLKYSRLINQSSEHLLSVVNEILFLFKLNMGKVYIEKVPFNSHYLVKNVHESMFLQASAKNLAFNIFIDQNVPELLIGDPFRIKQILMNLASNAIKFTDKGTISLNLFAEKIKNRKVFLRFQIKDTGTGISKEDLNKIFDEFVQSDLNNDKLRKGIGLGLTITRKLVDLLNGRLTAESELNKGSAFSVILPFEIPGKKELVLEEKKYNIKFNLLKGKKILYVDDDENNVLLAKSLLKGWKTDYEIAFDGNEALKLLREVKFDVVLLDIHMPGMSGVEVLETVKSGNDNLNRDTKMMAVTANILRSDIKKYMNSGFNDFILKPFREEDFYNKICALLDIEVQEDETAVTKKDQEKENIQDKPVLVFDTDLLLKNAGGDFDFFNQMINTFVRNSKAAIEGFEHDLAEKNWKGIGEKAHKLIPSFRYFGLSETVNELSELEHITLRRKEPEKVPKMIDPLIQSIREIINLAESAKIPEEKN